MNVCVIGTGYVGLVTGASLAYLNHDVLCVDIDAEKIANLRAGISPIYEPGLDELIASGLSNHRLSFTTNLNQAMFSSEIIFIAVGTPPLSDGTSDLSFLKAAAQDIGRGIVLNHRPGLSRIIINKSTVPVGCGNWVEMLIREQIRNLLKLRKFDENGHHNRVPQPKLIGKLAPQLAQAPKPEFYAEIAMEGALSDKNRNVNATGNGNGNGSISHCQQLVEQISTAFTVVSNPEFLREGSAIRDTFYPDRIVVGATDKRAFKMLKQLYQPLLTQTFDPPACIAPRPEGFSDVPLVTTDLASAEMIKYAANAFLAMKISFANEIANICEQTGADITYVMQGIGLDRRIGSRFLNAGLGWGGSCFGKDVSALIQIANEYGYRPELLDATIAVNKRQRRIPVQKLQGPLKIIKGRTIGLLGLAFKPGTDDVRDAPSLHLASDLLRMGAQVKVYDPVAMQTFQAQHPDLDLIYTSNVQELAADCDAVVLVTEWQEFRSLNLFALRQLMSGSVLVDGRNIFTAEAARKAGLKYIGIGRGE